jgi:hypothetical protein
MFSAGFYYNQISDCFTFLFLLLVLHYQIFRRRVIRPSWTRRW